TVRHACGAPHGFAPTERVPRFSCPENSATKPDADLVAHYFTRREQNVNSVCGYRWRQATVARSESSPPGRGAGLGDASRWHHPLRVRADHGAAPSLNRRARDDQSGPFPQFKAGRSVQELVADGAGVARCQLIVGQLPPQAPEGEPAAGREQGQDGEDEAGRSRELQPAVQEI